jgi:hypothetical protein
MGFFDNMFKGIKRYPDSVKNRITNSADGLTRIVNESIALASASTNIETKKTRLDYAMKKLVELIKLANEYPFLDFRKISSIYDSIREVRNEIKELELNKGIPVSPDSNEIQPVVQAKRATITESKDAPVCPYCSQQLHSMPLRKTACPSCNKMIYVWYSTTQNMKKLVTEEEAMLIEREITEHIDRYEFLNKQDTLEKTEDEVKKLQSLLKERDPNATLDDAYMFLLDKKIKDTRNPGEKSRLFYLKALMLDNAGKEFHEELKESKKFELLNLKRHDFVKNVQIITNSDSCEICMSHSDEVFSIETALKEMPLPHVDCSRNLYSNKGFCRCSYLIINE